MNLFPPQVDAKQTTVQIGDSVAFRNMFDASDLDGDEIQVVRFRDGNGLDTSGFFTIQGVRQPAGVFIEVDFDDLHLVRYQSGLIESNESFSVQVSDGERFSTVDTALANTVRQNFFPPEIETFNRTVQTDASIAASSFINVTDPENNAILRYYVSDSRPNQNGGFFELNGTRLPSAQFFLVEADQFQNLRYVGGRFNQSETVRFQAFDGEFWSDIETATATTLTNQNAPVVTTFNVNTPPGRNISGASLFSYFDADGNDMVTVGFRDTGTAEGTGFFTFNGAVQEAGKFFFVPANQLNNVRYQVSQNADSEVLQIFATDGLFASEVSDLTVTAVPRPKVEVLDFNVIVDTLQRRNVVDLITQIDNGPPMDTFQVIDQEMGLNSARLLLDGQRLEQGVPHTLTAEQFSRLQIEGGGADNRYFDQFLVRGRNSRFYTDWQEFNVYTDPVGPRSLPNGPDFSEFFFDGEKHIFTYTFIDGSPTGDPPRPPLPDYYPDDADEAEETQGLPVRLRNDVREMLATVEQFTDIDFVEVPFTPDVAEATFLFGMHMGGDESAHAFLPDGSDGRGTFAGDIWYDIEDFPPDSTPTGPGSFFRFVSLHELGHALGFKHSFDNSGPTLPAEVDRNIFTVMSYDPEGLFDSGPSTFMLWDVQALQSIYGVNEEFNLTNDHYFFGTNPTPQIVWDAGGRDTINMTNSVVAESIDLHQGNFSTINGVPESVLIAYGAEIENARGGGGADTLIGNSLRNLLFGNGNADILEGDGGNDVLRGGSGDDTYVWRLGDGRDRIDEQSRGGNDVIQIIDDTALSSLENDFVFRRFGNNLRIDLRFDRNEAQGSLRLKNQHLVESRVETLRLFNTNGDQIGEDIDLNSIFVQANSGAQFFRLTNQETANGFIAVPTV